MVAKNNVNMVDKVHITNHVNSLKFKAVERLNISPQKCHIGHIALQGMLIAPTDYNQIDAATGEMETNMSVATRSSRLANAMSNYGLKPGDAIILMGHNHLDLAIPFFASHFNGYSMCAIDTSVQPADLQSLWPYIKPKMVFCQKSCEEKVKHAFKLNNTEGEIVIFDDKNADLEAFIQTHNGSEINFRPAEFDQSIPAWLMLTSGTTGLPKVAIIPFDTLLNGICRWWTPFTKKFEVAMAMATLQWLSSLLYFISGPLRGYTRVQSSVPLTPQLLVELINKYKPNVTAWTPYLLGHFLVAAESVCDLSCFKYIAIGGSAIDKPLLDKFRKKCGAFLYLVYGMTELLVPIFDFGENTPFGSTGTPFEGYQFRIVDDDGHTLDKPFKTGELWVKSDAFFKGYLNNLEETRTMITEDGWVKTGDMFYRDDQDYYYFVERKRLMIKHFGFLISPLQMEEVIKRHPGVSEACVVAVPDPECMELPIAAILKKNGSKVEPQEIFALMKDALPDGKQLRGGLFYVDSFPVTPSGKIHRAQVRDMAFRVERIVPK